MEKHTEKCRKNIEARELLRIRYLVKWPNYCRECDGRGGFYSSYDPSPAGVSLSSGTMQDFEPCQACSENGRCPRCGAETLNDENEYSECSVCGWDLDDWGLPEPAECECWDPEWEEQRFNKSSWAEAEPGSAAEAVRSILNLK